MYLACPSIATNNDVRIPKLAPIPITLDTHFQPSDFPLNAAENGASASIYMVTTAPNSKKLSVIFQVICSGIKLIIIDSLIINYHIIREEHGHGSGHEAIENGDNYNRA